jgi:hypothetical protein
VPTGERDHEPDVFGAAEERRGYERLATAGGPVTTMLREAGGTPAGYTRLRSTRTVATPSRTTRPCSAGTAIAASELY